MTVLSFIAKYFWIAVVALIGIVCYGGWTYDSTRIFWDKELKEKGSVKDDDGKVITREGAIDTCFCWCMFHLLGLAGLSFLYWLVVVLR